jgi:serine/threonine protein kinase
MKPIFKPGGRCGGAYDITALVCCGPHAETYAATHRATGESVIVTGSRFLHVEGDPPSEAAFLVAAEKLASLAVREAPRIYGFGVSDGVSWIASQAFNEPTIVEYHALRQDKPPEWRVLDALGVAILVQSILEKAHALGVLHGNLRPACILVCGLPNDCDPRLLELGYADLFMLNRAAARASPRYRPPEQIAGAPIDPRSDVYSLGMAVYHLIAQAPPYADKAPVSTSARLLEMAERELPTPLPELTKHCPRSVWELVAKAIDKDPAKRFQSAGEMGDALEHLTDRILEDRGVGIAVREQGRELASQLRAKGPSGTATRPAPRAAAGSAEPTTVPPGADTKRRIRAALAQAREGTGDAGHPSSKPSTARKTPRSDGQPSRALRSAEPDSEPVTLPSAHQGIEKRPAQTARRPAWRARIALGGSLLAASGLAALAMIARTPLRPSAAIAWHAPPLMLPEAPTAATPEPVATAAPHPTGSASEPPAPAVSSGTTRLPRVRGSAAPPGPSSVGSATSPAEGPPSGPPADPCGIMFLCPGADPMPAASGTD